MEIFGRKPRMKDAEVEAHVMRGLAGFRGMSAAELQWVIEEDGSVRIPFATLYPALERLVERGAVTMIEGGLSRRGVPRRLYARTLRLVA